MKPPVWEEKKHESEVNWYHQLAHLKKQVMKWHMSHGHSVKKNSGCEWISSEHDFLGFKDAPGASSSKKPVERQFVREGFKSHFPCTQRNSIISIVRFQFLLNKEVHGFKKY